MDFSIGIPLPDKLKLLRKEEGLSQTAFCKLIEIPQTTLASFEAGKTKTIGFDTLTKIVSHPRFAKYAMWLLVDELSDAQAQEALEFLQGLKGYVEPPESD